MDSSDAFWLCAVLIIMAVGVAVDHFGGAAARRQEQARIDGWRSAAEAQFTGLVVDSPDPAFAFRGDAADVVEQTESIDRFDGGAPIGYTLKRFARNEAGEYFMFLSNSDGKPFFFKHVPQANARIALKKKYIAPPAQR
jgi:hypothetical protein